ncbi:hypothetical protein K3495_g10580 [Podosphaera aphanis]|nr:hypothetical protein K3495_g10580 [Podosphaera aphanis]
MPMYIDQTKPVWSNGWLQRFQQLYGIHKTPRYGEASSALASHDEEIRTIQQALTDFPLRESYHCDETNLFYKSVPKVSLTTCQLSGHKANKDRVTAMHTVSASGQVLKFWYIGTSKQPRCFKNVKIESFNFVYRNNKKAWMNTEIMIEYLKWYDMEMAGRPIHGTVVPTVTEASSATSCTEAKLVSLAKRVASQHGIQNIPSINDFVSPTSEEVFDDINTSEELYLEEIAELFNSNIRIENDEEDFEELGSGADFMEVDLDEAIAATKLLLKRQEQSGYGDGAKHLAYTRDLGQLQIRQENSRKQTTTTSFFSVDEG